SGGTGVAPGDRGGADLSRRAGSRRRKHAAGRLRLAILRFRAREGTRVATRLAPGDAPAPLADNWALDRGAGSSVTGLSADRIRESSARDERAADPLFGRIPRPEETVAGVLDHALGSELERVAIPRTGGHSELHRRAAIGSGVRREDTQIATRAGNRDL